MKRNPGLVFVLACMALGLAACDGSGAASTPNSPDPPGSSGPPQNPPEVAGAVTVQIVTVDGTPIPGVPVAVNGGDRYQDATTDAEGRVRFDEVPAGDVSVDAGGPGYHWAWRDIVVDEDETTDVALALVRSVEATPVVIARAAQPAGDGSTLTVDVDLAVLGEDGLAIPNFTAADFWISGSDCGFGMCVMDDAGQPLDSGSYSAQVDPGTFSWHEAPSGPAAASATALLLEHSTRLAEDDVQGRRAESVHAFLDSVTAPDSVAVASYRGTPQSPILSTYGPFTTDGALFHDDVDALATLESSLNPLYPALEATLAWTAMQPTAPASKSIVLVSTWSSWPDDDCGTSAGAWACRHERRVAIADLSRSLGIPVVTIGGSDPSADIAARSGGSSVVILDPEQFTVALANLKPIVSRQLGFNRVRFVLSSSAGVFASGHTVWSWGQVRVAPDSWVSIPVVIPIP